MLVEFDPAPNRVRIEDDHTVGALRHQQVGESAGATVSGAAAVDHPAGADSRTNHDRLDHPGVAIRQHPHDFARIGLNGQASPVGHAPQLPADYIMARAGDQLS
jgi:hypothetical protein